MSNEIVFTIIFLLIFMGTVFVLVTLAKEISQKMQTVEDFVNESSTWPSVEGIILELGLNLEYDWPEGEIERPHISAKILEKKRQEFFENSIYHQTLVRYEYSALDQTYESRNIQIVPCQPHHSIVHKLEIGDRISVKYNPQNPQECYIKKSSKEDIKQYGWLLMQDLKPTLILCAGSLLIFFALLTQVLTKNV
jgi:hypothetical protein